MAAPARGGGDPPICDASCQPLPFHSHVPAAPTCPDPSELADCPPKRTARPLAVSNAIVQADRGPGVAGGSEAVSLYAQRPPPWTSTAGRSRDANDSISAWVGSAETDGSCARDRSTTFAARARCGFELSSPRTRPRRVALHATRRTRV